ncbi:hypothetical protein OR1_03012 [Geobacter sp. OR-1]|uniref:hypothetical protein n=1 Tax=Geobacter sp. OR-1 TaxID=1266765 RepID=UPI000543EDF5|nr:hypothetical protein [Geobacter sp. OR-1]GAM10719.1 hypothetical protein OR1_03012 [Geobacter sp. OR-1]
MAQKEVHPILQRLHLDRLAKSYFGIIASYWLFQGMLYMDRREAAFKIFLDSILVGLLVVLHVNIVVSILIAHSINMFINGHLYVLRKNIGKCHSNPKDFIAYVEKMYLRIQGIKFLTGAAAYGSLSRNEFKSSSDYDLRVFPANNATSWLKAVVWVFIERFRALLHGFPLDIYAFNLEVHDRKIRSDEPPIVIFDPLGIIARKYSASVSFADFAARFKATYIPNENDRKHNYV